MKIESIFNQSSNYVNNAVASNNAKTKLKGLMAQIGMMQLQIPAGAQAPVSQAIADAQTAIDSDNEEAIQEQIERFLKMQKMLQEMMMLQASINMMGNSEDEDEQTQEANALIADTQSYQQTMLNASIQKLMTFVGGALGYDQQIKDQINTTVEDSLRNMLGL